MNTSETVIVCVAIVAATTAAVLGSLGPELAGIIGVAIGYGGKGAIGVRSGASEDWNPAP